MWSPGGERCPTSFDLAQGVESFPAVLVVDDESDVRGLIRLVLERGGCRVTEAPSGAAALELLRTPLWPDVLVSDVAMPVMSGTDLIAQVRADPLHSAMPIVAVSADPFALKSSALTTLVDATVDKACVVATLVSVVMRLGSH